MYLMNYISFTTISRAHAFVVKEHQRSALLAYPE